MSVEVLDLQFRYPGQALLLQDVSFKIAAGETLCLLGPNGSGKTTLLRCILNIAKIESGAIRINGNDIHRMSRRTLAREIAWVPQSTVVMFPFSVFDIVIMGRTPHTDGISSPSKQDGQRAIAALERLGIAHLRDRAFNEISGGERQLVLIARALCQEARVLVMDEPAASLDYGNQIKVLRIINELRQSGYAVIMSAHNPDHAFLSATHAAILKAGCLIAFGNPNSIITSRTLSDLYAARISVLSAPLPEDPEKFAKVCIPIL